MTTRSSAKIALGPLQLTPLGWGALIGIATLILDQLTKIWFLVAAGRPLFAAPENFQPGPSFDVLPFLNFTLVWNRGMSYGLLQAETALGRGIFTAFTIIVVPVLAWWLARTRSIYVALALGLVIGGAIGNNLIDRIFYHAVVDFLHFHIGQFHWYVFNIADTAIVFGVFLLIYDSFWGTEQS